MPRGRWTNHKGRSRRFTNPEALEEERRREEEKKEARDRRHLYRDSGDSSSENEEENKPKGRKGVGASSGSEGSESDTESESEEEVESKGKGVEKLIEISNPNRVQRKTKKLSTLNETLETSSKPELSRREREELEKEAARARYQKLHAEGRTEEARADLARLAIIKAQREEAAMKRKLDKLEKEKQLKSKQEAIGRALDRKT